MSWAKGREVLQWVMLKLSMMQTMVRVVIGAALLAGSGAALAERVYVKARGEVNLAPFRCETIARSQNVKRICYDEREKYVLVSLSGIWYHYCGVPVATVVEWKKARNKGRYFNDSIRQNFECGESSTPAPAYR